MRFVPSISAWRARRTLRGYIDPKLVDEVVNNPNLQLGPPRHRQLDFIIALLRDDNFETLPTLVQKVVQSAAPDTESIDGLTGPLILLTFGRFRPEPDAPRKRRETVARLQQHLGNDIKVLHGHCTAKVGHLGGHSFAVFGSLLPNFNTMLQTLLVLQFGQSRERPTAPPTHSGPEQSA